ncbi:hypothetical protein FMEAI12_7050012 [Parafrankia sp. Ea1.12]|nr:hypothetical protein FMEAI12_7050012 [Parafrankia sp. Ea1.12]
MSGPAAPGGREPAELGLRQEPGRLVRHVGIDEQVVAIGTQRRHGDEIPPAPAERIHQQTHQSTEDYAEDGSVEREQHRCLNRIDPVEQTEDPADQRARDGTGERRPASHRGPGQPTRDLLDRVQVAADDGGLLHREVKVGKSIDGPFGIGVGTEDGDHFLRPDRAAGPVRTVRPPLTPSIIDARVTAVENPSSRSTGSKVIRSGAAGTALICPEIAITM